jgi:hypothetical protein
MNLHVGLAGAPQQNLEVVNPIDPILVVVYLDVFEEIQAELPIPPLQLSLAWAMSFFEQRGPEGPRSCIKPRQLQTNLQTGPKNRKITTASWK